MAVVIVERLTLSPLSVSLPAAVEAQQTLRTTAEASATVVLQYQLPDGFDVWFEEGGQQTRVAQRSHPIADTPTALLDRLRLVSGAGEALDTVEVVLSICDPDCRVRDIGMLQILR
jgi:hypothetical protein